MPSSTRCQVFTVLALTLDSLSFARAILGDANVDHGVLWLVRLHG